MFRNNFLWGGAISASQTEGSHNVDGRTPSVMELVPRNKNLDRTVNIMPKISRETLIEGLNNDDRSIYPKKYGIDFYNTYKEDIKLFAEMGFKVFRFSMSWSRVYPDVNSEEPNIKALEFYDNVVNTCLEYNIEPLVTILHGDLPVQIALEYDGWSNRKVIDLYLKYATTLLNHFKGRVKYWVPINEINLDLYSGSRKLGILHDGEENFEELVYSGIHNEFLASVQIANIAHEIDSENKVGHMIAAFPIYPLTSKPEDNIAAIDEDRIKNLFFFDVLYNGKYPYYIFDYWKKNNINIEISEDDKRILKQTSPDFIGLSYYNSMVTSFDKTDLDFTGGNLINSIKNPYLNQSEWGWQIDPIGFRYVLHHIYDRYKLPIFILENGIGVVEELDKNNKVHDDYRIDFLSKHIKEMKQAVEEGVEVIGYTMWGCIDLVSAGTSEMSKRYGFIYVDQDNEGNGTKKRYKKDSFYWYKELIEENGNNI